jgi:hypothetical protein
MPGRRGFFRSLKILAAFCGLTLLVLLARATGRAQSSAGPESPIEHVAIQAPKPEAPKAPAARAVKDEAAQDVLTRLDTLSEALLKRLDEADQAEAVWADQRVVAAFAQNAVQEAKRSLETAKSNRSEYEKTAYPAERKTVLGELHIAEEQYKQESIRMEWMARMLKNKMASEAAYNQSEYNTHRAEILIADAKARLEKLDGYTKQQRLAELQTEVLRAYDDVALRSNSAERERAREITLESHARHAALIAEETQCLALVDEVYSLLAKENAAPAEAKIREAERLWLRAMARRTELRRTDARDRLHRALSQPSRSLPPPNPTPG